MTQDAGEFGRAARRLLGQTITKDSVAVATDEWSDEARKKAAEARKHGGGAKAKEQPKAKEQSKISKADRKHFEQASEALENAPDDLSDKEAANWAVEHMGEKRLGKKVGPSAKSLREWEKKLKALPDHGWRFNG